ncbi:MAG: hypothetical protein Q7J67_00215 [bacterium]|nr:hypothetical protein [bacterium]
MSIDWDANRIAYNRDNGTKYKSRWMLLKQLYNKHTSLYRASKAICISHKAFARAIRDENKLRAAKGKLQLKLLPKGHRFPSLAQKKVLNMDTKTIDIGYKELIVSSDGEFIGDNTTGNVMNADWNTARNTLYI